MSSPTKYEPLSAIPSGGNPASQATEIEQSRAIAEVKAAVVVAQQVPRDTRRAEAEMRDTCGRMAMANQAFYQVQNRGTGPSIHLMRELARIWGNIDYGVKELRRDDERGYSEVLAWSWDVQCNTRSTRTFIVPHARMKSGRRQELTDLSDIYLNNQNTGARAVRETIASILPRWYTESAQDICRQTLEHGEGEPLPARIEKMVAVFRALGVTEAQMEAKIGKKRGAWDAGDVAQMGITYTSITRDGLDKSEAFPAAASLLADEITAAAKEKKQPETDPEASTAGDLAPDDQRATERGGATEPGAEEVPAPGGGEPTPPPGSGTTEDVDPAEVNSRGEFLATKKDIGTIRGLLANAKYSFRTKESTADTYAYLASVIGRDISDINDLSETEAADVIAALNNTSKEN